jgi:hypothetical protein
MAFAFVSQSAASGTGTTTTNVPYPVTVNAGEIAFLSIVSAYSPNFPDTPAGWDLIGRANGGAGASGVDSGERTISVYMRICDGTEDGTNVTITATGLNGMLGRIFTLSKASTHSLLAESFGTGADTTSGTDYSITTSQNVSLMGGDLLMAFSAINTETPTWGTQGYSAVTGVVIGTTSERTDGGSTIGDDMKIVLTTTPITSGSANAPLTYTMTGTAAAAGATIIIRLRELARKLRVC